MPLTLNATSPFAAAPVAPAPAEVWIEQPDPDCVLIDGIWQWQYADGDTDPLLTIEDIQSALIATEPMDDTEFAVTRLHDTFSVMIHPQNKTILITENKVTIYNNRDGSVTELDGGSEEGAIAIDDVATDFAHNWLQ